MLKRISIKNLALIRDAELEFSDKLNILSGETGAGKSIIVDALMLLMGGKYDKMMLILFLILKISHAAVVVELLNLMLFYMRNL